MTHPTTATPELDDELRALFDDAYQLFRDGLATASGEVDACRVVNTAIYAGIAAGIDYCHSRHVTS